MNTFIKRLIRHFRKPTSNQKGSVLSVSLIVVAILSLSITTLTGNTVNLSTATTQIQDNMEDTSLSKKLIDATIADLKSKLPLYFDQEYPIIAYFEDYADSDGIFTMDGYNSPEIVHKDTGVTIKKDMNFPDFGPEDYASQQPIKFTHSTLSKYSYFLFVPGSGLDSGIGNDAVADILGDPPSGDFTIWDAETAADYDRNSYFDGDIVYAGGDYYVRTDYTKGGDDKVPWEFDGNGNANGWFKDWIPYDGEITLEGGFDPQRDYEIDFYFSLVTNGDMYLNGGLYNIPSLFADNIYSSFVSIYEYNNNFHSSVPNVVDKDELYPDFSGDSEATKVFLQGDYNYCSPAASSACVTINVDGDVQFNREQYGLIEESSIFATDYYGAIQAVNLEGFFDAYNFNDELLEFIWKTAPTGDLMLNEDLITLSDIESPGLDLTNKLLSTDTSYFIDISNQVDKDDFLSLNNQNVSAIYNGDLTLTDTYNSSEDHTLVVLGDLTINMSGDQSSIIGNILVTGNTTFIGDSVRFQGTLITLGQTTINFNSNEGFYVTDENPKNFTLLSRDNLIFNSIYATDALTENVNDFYGFFYTEESIYIDAVNSNINLHGSLYARATNATNSTDLPFVDETGAPINGIIINSVYGYLGSNGVINSFNPANDIDLNKTRYTRFIQQDISDDTIQDQFSNLPLFQVGVKGEDTFIDDGFEEE